ncbi:MAG: MFS transporter [Methanobacteriota archaeon]
MPGDRRVLLANSIYHLTNDAAVTVMAGQITVLRNALQFGAFEIGLLSGVGLLVTAVFQIAFGAMSDRREPSRFLSSGIVLLGVGTILLAASTSWQMLLAIVALSRIGASFYHPVGIAWIGREFEGESLDRSMGFQSAFGDSGVILGLASAAVLGAGVAWQAPFVVWGVLNLAAVAIVLAIVPRRRLPPPRPAARADYLGMARDVRLWLFPLGLGGASFVIFTSFGPPLLKDKFGFSDAASGIAIAVWILAGATVAFFFGRVSRRFGRFRTLVASYALLGIACVVGATVANEFLVLGAFWTLGSALFVTYPALFSFVSEASHRELKGAAFGFIFSFQLLGGAVGSFAAGALAGAFESTPTVRASVPFALCAGLVLSGFAYLVALRRRLGNAVPSPTVPPAL